MFQRLESVLHSEIKSLGHPRAALLGFAAAVLAYNVLALLKRVIEQAHEATHPELDVSTFHLTVEINSGYEAVAVALPPEHLCHGRATWRRASSCSACCCWALASSPDSWPPASMHPNQSFSRASW